MRGVNWLWGEFERGRAMLGLLLVTRALAFASGNDCRTMLAFAKSIHPH